MTANGEGQAACSSAVDPYKYPKTIELRNGAVLALRLMTAADCPALLAFFRGIPPEDLLFLRCDVTDAREIDEWAERVGRGAVLTVLAERGGAIVGEASLHFNDVPWTAHVGEIRVVTDRAVRQ